MGPTGLNLSNSPSPLSCMSAASTTFSPHPRYPAPPTPAAAPSPSCSLPEAMLLRADGGPDGGISCGLLLLPSMLSNALPSFFSRFVAVQGAFGSKGLKPFSHLLG
jgi:hypothetical protein